MRSGKKDIEGKEIKNGDIVVFYWDEQLGYGESKYTEKGVFTEMVDICFFNRKDCRFVLWSNIGNGAYLERHSDNCKVIGSVMIEEDRLEKLKGWDPMLVKLLSQEFLSINN